MASSVAASYSDAQTRRSEVQSCESPEVSTARTHSRILHAAQLPTPSCARRCVLTSTSDICELSAVGDTSGLPVARARRASCSLSSSVDGVLLREPRSPAFLRLGGTSEQKSSTSAEATADGVLFDSSPPRDASESTAGLRASLSSVPAGVAVTRTPPSALVRPGRDVDLVFGGMLSECVLRCE